MKKLISICLFLFVILLPQISFSLTPGSSDVEKVIELDGSLNNVSTRSILSDPISATIGPNSLNVNFLYNVGNISVEVYSLSGELIYEADVDTSIQSSMSIINVTDWSSNFYEIRFVNSTGNYMYGTFEIE